MHRFTVALDLVVSDPDVFGGMHVICGACIAVYDVAASVAADIPAARILAAYPLLDGDMIEFATIYARANPPPRRQARKASMQMSRFTPG